MTGSDAPAESRRYHMLRSAVEAYRARRLTLGRLVSTLEALIADVDEPAVRDSLTAEWGTLEVVHAIAVDRECRELEPAERRLVDDALAAIVRILDQRPWPGSTQ